MAHAGGRPRKPTNLKLVTGTQRKGRANPAEPVPPPGEPSCPEWATEAGRAFWDRETAQCREMGTLAGCDQSTWEEYLRAEENGLAAEAAIRANGGPYSRLTNKAGEEYVALHPAAIERRYWHQQKLKIAGLFGLNRSDAQRVVAKPKEEQSATERLRAAKAKRVTARRNAG